MPAEPNVLVIVLAGGEGKRLLPLTNDRAKPAVPFGGCYRLIDFALSNFANARYLKIVVLTQYKSHSLDRHISQTWRFSTLLDDYVAPVPAQMRRGPFWFQGSADAIYQNLNLIHDENPDLVCVFGADHIYRMDPRQMVDHHLAAGAGVTVAAIPVPKHEATDFGVIEVNEVGQILDFHEKVADPPTMPGDPTRCLASMGNYVFDTKTLIEIVTPRDDAYTDIGGHVIPALTRAGVAHVYDFSTNVVPGQDEREAGLLARRRHDRRLLRGEHGPDRPAPGVQPLQRPLAGVHAPRRRAAGQGVARARAASRRTSTAACCARARSSPAPTSSARSSRPGVYVDHDAHVTDSILFPGVRVGPGARLHRCIVDKNVAVPEWYRIGLDAGEDRERFTVSDDGIAVIEKDRTSSAERRPGQVPGEAGDDGGEGVDVVAADDDVAEAELLAPAHQLLGDRRRAADEGERRLGDHRLVDTDEPGDARADGRPGRR